ncbi:MAG TPA: GGDEF domain-containing protein [bacterium]|nr:GGDEF domain-containing protein [bacterium]
MKNSFSFALAGIGLGLGAPLGAFLLHPLWATGVWEGSASLEWSRNGFFYGYMLLGTCAAFGAFGFFLGRKTDQVLSRNQALSHEVLTDPLTGLGNHRFLHDYLKVEFRDPVKKPGPMACLMMDLDFFKRVNDTHGHPFGDRVLVGFARIVKRCLRQGDIATRYGGEEFLCILPNCDEANARKVAERIRAETEKEVFVDGDHRARITVSVGVVMVPSPLQIPHQSIIDAADRNLYEAKNRGRNQVVLHTLSSLPPFPPK